MKWWYWILIILFLISFLFCILTLSYAGGSEMLYRISLVSMIIILLIFVYDKIRNRGKIYRIILIVAILILIVLPFLTPIRSFPKEPGSSINKACEILVRNGCEMKTSEILIENFDANKDGKINSEDTLFELCKYEYGTETDEECKRAACGCE